MVVKTNSKVGVSNEPMFRMIKLSCERGRVYEDQLSKRGQVRKSSGVINTKKPTHKVEMCGFFLTVYQRTSDNRFFVRKSQSTCWQHNNHTEIPEKLMREGIDSVAEETLETARRLLADNMSTQHVKQFISIEDGVQLTDVSIQGLRRQVMMSQFEGQSTGQKLVEDLKKTEGTEVVMLTGSYDQASKQVRVTRSRSRVLAKNKLSNPEKENVDVNELGDEAADHVKNVVLGLGLGNGEYLIAIAWSTAEQVSQFL